MPTDLLAEKTSRNKPKDLLADKAPTGRDPLWAQAGGKVIDTALGLPGFPLDMIIGGGNFLRRQMGLPEFVPNETVKQFTSEGISNAAKRNMTDPFTGRKVSEFLNVDPPATEEERLAQKAGSFLGGGVPFGPGAMVPALSSLAFSEGGRELDKAAPETTKGYGETAGAVLGGFAPWAAKQALMPTTTPEQARIAQDLMNQGVEVFPGQLASSPMVRNALDMADKVAIYDNGRTARQADAVSRVISRTMGENEPDLRTAAEQAQNRLSGVPDPANPVGPKLQPGVYDQIYQRIGNHQIDARAVSEIGQLRHRAQQLTGRSREAVETAVQRIAEAIDPQTGRLTIRGFKDLTDQGGVLSELENATNPALALYGRQLRQVLEHNIARQANPMDAQALAQADRQWRHLKTLEPVIARSADAEGHISPALLQSRIATASGNANARGASGMPELETVAQAGKSFLRPPRSSGTAERSALAGIAGGGGPGALTGAVLGGPVGAAAGFALNILTPLAVRRTLQSQGITRSMIREALNRGNMPNAVIRMLGSVGSTGAATSGGIASEKNKDINDDWLRKRREELMRTRGYPERPGGYPYTISTRK